MNLLITLFSILLFVTSFKKAERQISVEILGHYKKWERSVLGEFLCSTEDFPFMVIILKIFKKRIISRFCGGSLIDPYHVLTAAKCTGKFNLLVVAGMNSIGGNPELRIVTRQIPHPSFDRQLHKHDIAVLTLDLPIRRSAYINYAVLPSSPYSTEFLENSCKQGLAIGWGHTSSQMMKQDSPNLTSLQCAILPLIALLSCKRMYGFVQIYESNICSLSNERNGTCRGDSGGPLLCGLVQIGIVSRGRECVDIKNYPLIYTRVDQHLDFIEASSDFKRRYTGDIEDPSFSFTVSNHNHFSTFLFGLLCFFVFSMEI